MLGGQRPKHLPAMTKAFSQLKKNRKSFYPTLGPYPLTKKCGHMVQYINSSSALASFTVIFQFSSHCFVSSLFLMLFALINQKDFIYVLHVAYIPSQHVNMANSVCFQLMKKKEKSQKKVHSGPSYGTTEQFQGFSANLK